jgi:uncharacterized phage-associated protein
MPMYEARKICNCLLARYDSKRHDLTNLRLNKLLFFIHGESLKIRPNGLIRNHFEAWQFGPVIRSVFDTFKVYGDNIITMPAYYLDYASGKEVPIPYDDISQSDVRIIEQAFDEYSRLSTGQLVALSHESGGPWDLVYGAILSDRSQSALIPNELIRRHFTGELHSTLRH